MKIKLLLITVLFLSSISGFAQEKQEEKGVWELSLSPIFSYVPSLSEGLVKSEFHVTYWFTHKWGGGVSYTHKFIDGTEINDDIALIGSYNVTKYLMINLGLNYTIPKEGGESGIVGFYNEAEINFRPNKWLSFGPLVGSVISKRTELYTGAHISFEF